MTTLLGRPNPFVGSGPRAGKLGGVQGLLPLEEVLRALRITYLVACAVLAARDGTI
jgi:hypothetical protein